MGREREIGCVVIRMLTGMEPAAWGCAVTGNRTHSILVYGTTLQPTWQQWLGQHLTLWLHSFTISSKSSGGGGMEFWGDCLCLILSSPGYFILFCLTWIFWGELYFLYMKLCIWCFSSVVTLRLFLRQCQTHLS